MFDFITSQAVRRGAKRFATAVLATLLLLVQMDARAEPKDLLIPVGPSEAAQVEDENQYFLKKHLYIAQRYKLVRVRTDLLLRAEKVRISLFDDQSLIFKVTSLKTDDTGASIRWRGILATPSFSPDDLPRQSPSESLEQAEFIHSELFSLSITAARYDFHVPSGHFMPSVDYLRALSCDSKDKKEEARSVYGVTAEIAIPGLDNEYRLVSLEMTPAYHLLIEVDQSRVAPPGPLVDPEHPEMAARRRAYATFLQSLGENPRKAIEEEFLRSIRQRQLSPNCEQ